MHASEEIRANARPLVAEETSANKAAETDTRGASSEAHGSQDGDSRRQARSTARHGGGCQRWSAALLTRARASGVGSSCFSSARSCSARYFATFSLSGRCARRRACRCAVTALRRPSRLGNDARATRERQSERLMLQSDRLLCGSRGGFWGSRSWRRTVQTARGA